MATEHLIEVGCRIAHIGGTGISTAAVRLNGYQSALKRHGLAADAEYVIGREHADEPSGDTDHEAMNQLLALERSPDGVFCYNRDGRDAGRPRKAGPDSGRQRIHRTGATFATPSFSISRSLRSISKAKTQPRVGEYPADARTDRARIQFPPVA